MDSPGSDAKQTILVVDDAPDSLSLISDLLSPFYRIKVATNGEKALEIARAVPHPDLILLDIMMPGMSGYVVIRELKGNPTTHDIPVIFLAAATAKEDEQMGLALGAAAYAVKPISLPVVMEQIAKHLVGTADSQSARIECS